MTKNKVEKEEVFAACKRGNDPATSGQSCDSKQAYKMSVTGARSVSLQCVKCGYNWNIVVGGSFNS